MKGRVIAFYRGGVCPARVPGRFALPRPRGLGRAVMEPPRPLPGRGSRGPGQAVCTITNITNNLRVINHILLRVATGPGGAAGRGRAGCWNGRSPGVAGLAGEAIDRALRSELDRQLAEMARGEGVAANQRRRAMLGAYLLRQEPRRILRGFYKAAMEASPRALPAQEGQDGEEFHTDLITRRETRVERTIQRQTHWETTLSAPAPLGPRDSAGLKRLADEVAGQVEKRMRLNRERTGLR